jgi:AraC-like DNA-binding protein
MHASLCAAGDRLQAETLPGAHHKAAGLAHEPERTHRARLRAHIGRNRLLCGLRGIAVQHFSTDSVAPSQRYSYWREAVCSTFVPLDVVCDQRLPFRSELSVRPAAGFDLITVRGSAQQVRRGSRLIDTDGSECLIVMAQSQGGGVATQGDRASCLSPGSLTVLDSRRPYKLDFTSDFEQTALKVPLTLLVRHGSKELAGRASLINAETRLGALAQHTIVALAAERNPSRALSLGAMTLEMLVLALQDAAGETIESPARMETLRVTWAHAHIASSLHDPALGPASVARAQGVSLRLLQRLFARQGLQIAECICEQRLQRSRAALQDPAQAGRSITDVAFDWGFNDPGHFSKAFKRRFGMSPRQSRDSA